MMFSCMTDITVKSESVRIEFYVDWAEVRIGNAEFTIIHENVALGTLPDLLESLLEFAKTVAADRGEKLEQFDARSDSGRIWMGKDVRF